MLWIRTAIAAASMTLACGSAMGGSQDNRPIVPTSSYDDDQSQQDQNQYQPDQNQNQNQAQNQQNQSDNDAAVESFSWVNGQSHLGVVVMQMTRDLRSYFGAPTDRGVLVAKVEPRSAAARAGIRTGDVIVDVANSPVSSADDVIAALSQQTSGKLRVSVIRNGEQQTLTARLPGQHQQQDQQNSTL